MFQPRLSIGLPVYNGKDYLRLSLDSILRQDFEDFELIISDNASTDETCEICQQYAQHDKRIRYFRNESNLGATKNYRRVFELARGEYFNWATHDDVQLPGFLRRCVEVFEKAPDSVVLVAPRAEIIDEQGNRIQNWQAERLQTKRRWPYQRISDVLRELNWATAHLGLYRSEALRKTRLIDRFHAADYVLLVETAILGEIWEVPEILFQRRFHSGASTNANRTPARLMEWFDPSQKASGLFSHMSLELAPRTKLALECTRSILRMPLDPKERLRCFIASSTVGSVVEIRRLSREYWRRLRNQVGRARRSIVWRPQALPPKQS
jgi:glycosyltransferase involved in cell wall biosynthesis